MASRLHLLASPLNILQLRRNPWLYRQYLRSAVQSVTLGMGVLAAASRIPGVKVEWRPNATNFGRIRIGNTKFDIWGGFQPQARLIARLVTGKFIGSSGKEWDLNQGGYGHSSQADILIDYFRSKASPNAALLWDMFDHQDQIGNKFVWQQQWSRLLPLLTGDVWNTLKDGQDQGGFWNTLTNTRNYPRAAAVEAAGLVGLGAQTYGETKREKKASRPYVGVGGTGGYLDGSSGSSGGYLGGGSGTSGGYLP
jgi:hypothetical protein